MRTQNDYKYMTKSGLIAACEKMEAEIAELKAEAKSIPSHVAWLIETADHMLAAARMLTEVREEQSD